MRKSLLWMLPALLLVSGCAGQEVFEQVEDDYAVLAPAPESILVELPPEAAVTAMGSDRDHAIYFCDGYTLTVQTLAGGDMGRSIEELTGFSPEQITLLQTGDGSVRRYTGTWTCAGEAGDQVGRFVLLDDGDYHYAVTVMAPAECIGELQLAWDSVLRSVNLGSTAPELPDTDPGTDG